MLFVIIWKNKESHLLISVQFYRFVCVIHEESRGPEGPGLSIQAAVVVFSCNGIEVPM